MARRKWVRAILVVLVCCACIGILLALVIDPEPKLAATLRDLRDPSPFVQMRAQEALRSRGSNAVPSLKRRLHARDWAITTNIVAFLQRRTFLKISFVPARERRIRSAIGCVVLGPPAIGALSDLLTLSKEDTYCFNLAQSALSHLGPEAIQPLSLQLTNADWRMRELAAGALAHIGPGVSHAVPGLSQCLNDEWIGVRVEAARALGEVEVVSMPVVRALVTALKDRDRSVRMTAEVSLEGFKTGARDHLLLLQTDPDISVRTNAIRMLKWLETNCAIPEVR